MDSLLAEDPSAIGDYRLLGRLGAGGMGLVYLGRSPAGRLVAIKTVHARFAAEPGFRARFRREVTAAKAVSGAFTAALIDADPQARKPWLATEFLAGCTLQDAIDEHGPMPGPAVFALGAGLAEALASMHRAGVVHRDLKPTNVMLTKDGPRVIDFGIAHTTEISVITQVGHVVGSPGYLSPEQATGDATGPPSDVFSLGAVLVFAATGHGPYGTAAPAALIFRIAHGRPDLTAVADPRLRELVAACLDPDPGRRPAVGELLDLLRPHLSQALKLRSTEWLPPPVAAEVSRRATLNLPPDAGRGRYDSREGEPDPSGWDGSPAGAGEAGGGDPLTHGKRPRVAAAMSRRRLVGTGLGLAAGAGVLAWGGSRLAGSTWAGADAPESSASASGRPVEAPNTAPANPIRWRLKAAALSTASAAVTKDAVYVGSDNELLALTPDKGEQIWRWVMSGEVTSMPVPVPSRGAVIVVDDSGSVAAIDARTGLSQWTSRLEGEEFGDPVAAASGRLLVPCADGARGKVYALVNGGEPVWTGSFASKVIGVAESGGTVVCSTGSALTAFDVASGRQRWSLPGTFAGAPTINDGVVYCAASSTGRLHAVGLNGALRWAQGTSFAAEYGRPCVIGGVVCVGSSDGILEAYDIATGARRWNRALLTFGGGSMTGGAVTAHGSMHLVSGGHLIAVDPATGDVRSAFRLPYASLGSGRVTPAADSEAIYIGWLDVYALRPVQG